MTITTTWHYPTRPGFVSAWDATRNSIGHEVFDALDRADQCKTVQRYVCSIPSKAVTESKRQPNARARAISRRTQRTIKLSAPSN